MTQQREAPPTYIDFDDFSNDTYDSNLYGSDDDIDNVLNEFSSEIEKKQQQQQTIKHIEEKLAQGQLDALPPLQPTYLKPSIKPDTGPAASVILPGAPDGPDGPDTLPSTLHPTDNVATQFVHFNSTSQDQETIKDPDESIIADDALFDAPSVPNTFGPTTSIRQKRDRDSKDSDEHINLSNPNQTDDLAGGMEDYFLGQSSSDDEEDFENLEEQDQYGSFIESSFVAACEESISLDWQNWKAHPNLENDIHADDDPRTLPDEPSIVQLFIPQFWDVEDTEDHPVNEIDDSHYDEDNVTF